MTSSFSTRVSAKNTDFLDEVLLVCKFDDYDLRRKTRLISFLCFALAKKTCEYPILTIF